MTRDELRKAVLDALGSVAPELAPESIDPKKNLRDCYDLDSVDFFNFIVAVHAATGIDIPEAEFSKVATLDDCVAYLESKSGAR
jgi:acyl carrier protein